MPTRYFVGLDLGRPSEPTALAVLSRERLTPRDRTDRRPTYALSHLKRFPPGTPYPAVLAGLVALLKAPVLHRSWVLADYTGAGWPVQQMLAGGLKGTVCCHYSAVILTASGTMVPGGRGGLAIPKADVVGTLQVLLQTRRLRIAKELPEVQTLTRELAAYRPKVTLAPAEATTWREGAHDDLVFAAGLAAWGGEAALPR